MKKRRKFSEIYKDMDYINKRKSTLEEVKELEEVLRESELTISEPEGGSHSDEIPHTDRTAMSYSRA